MADALKDIDVFILCGGKGTRLRSVSRDVPKPLVEVAGRPFLDWVIDYLEGAGFRRFILGTGYKGRLIREYYTKKKKKDVSIRFSHETVPLDTGGAVKKAKRLITSNPFFVLNGDSFGAFDAAEFLRFHRGKEAPISILLRRVSRGGDFGQISRGASRRVTGFNEKNPQAKNCFINGGVYIFDQAVFSDMPAAGRFSLERDLFPRMTGKGIFGYYAPGFFIDIGTPERFVKAEKYFLRGKERNI
jgi:NDP-sugar pyrophosphorylase family protein